MATEAVAELVPRLRSVLRGEVATDAGTRAMYASDASNYRVLPSAVVAPATVDELAAVVHLAAEAGVPLTMRGTGTSIAGNAIGSGIVVDASRHLRGITALDADARTVTVLSGTILDDVNAAAARHRLRVGPDPSTHSRCTVGGMVGNNACGSHSVRWGTTAQNVLGLELITADGTRRRSDALGPALDTRLRAFLGRHTDLFRAELPPWPRRVSGYGLDWLLPERGFDVARALTGTEGTCAVVASATLRLVEPPAVTGLLVLAFRDDIEAAAAVPSLLPEEPLTVESLTAELLAAWTDPGLLPPGGAWLLVEVGGDDAGAVRDHAARLAAAIGRGVGSSGTRLLQDPAQQHVLWAVREDGAGRAARLPDGTPAWPGFEDAAVPPDRLASYLGALHGLLRDADLRGVTYGHLGEGCIHLRVGFGLDAPGGEARFRGFMEAAADLVVAHGGTLSGEHGDGRARSELLGRQFSPAMLAAFGEWKAMWDEHNMLNPGIIVDPLPFTLGLRRPRPTTLAPFTPGLAFSADVGDLRSAVERCIGVGRCVSTQGHELLCPSYRATGEERHSTRGRARLLQEMAAGSLADDGWRSPEVHEALDLCLSCRACLSDCPTGVDMASYKSEVLHQRYRGRLRPRSHYLLGRLPRWLGLTRRVPGGVRAVNALTAFGPSRRLAALVGGLAGERPVPRLAPRTFRDGFAHPAPTTPVRGQVVLWPDTFTEHLAPEVGHAAVRVLAAAGFDVAVPRGDVCCGLTWTTTGQLDGAKAVLRRTLDTPGIGDGADPIVILEPSCAASLRLDLPELLPGDPRARAVADRVTTLAALLDVAGWAPPDGPPLDVLVQPHCHHQAVLGTAADGRLMAAAAIVPTEVLSGCCGLAGTFGVQAGHERITRRVAELELLPALRRTAAGTRILADGFSCRTQIAFLDGRRARHLAEVLAERLDQPG
ncbi:MAG TPA: FAD-binding and (Fe-S)-binding domain-containing protein [Candidatus Limnocylindrales bacterium]